MKAINKLATLPVFRLILGAKSVLGLLVRIVVLLAIPYAYLMLCGLVFDMWLRWYFMTGFIFYSLLALYAIALVLAVLAVIRFVWCVQQAKNKKSKRKGV